MTEILFNSRVCLLPPLPPVADAAVCAELSYRYRKYLRGKEAWARFGKATGNEFINKTFVKRETDGRISMPAGFANRMFDILSGFGLNPVLVPSGFPDVKPDWARLKSQVDFRESQEEVMQKLVSSYHGGIEAAPGYGKGFLIRCLIELFPHSTFDVTSDSTVVCRNIQDYLAPHVPDLGFIGDGDKKKGSRINIYVLDSLHHASGDEDFLIVDEVHTAVTEKASAKFAIYKRARRFWLSATPEGRSDNSDLRVEALFGKAVAVIPYQECVRMGLIVNIHVDWINVHMGYNPISGVSDPTAKARLGVWRNDFRNRLLAEHINAIPDNQQTLVLTSRVEHLCNLFPYLHGFELAFGANENSIQEARSWADFGKVPSSCLEDRKQQNENMRKAFGSGSLKKVIVTSIWDTGANFPKLSDIFRTDPFDSNSTKDVQAPGRGSRTDGELKTHATLHDTIDHFDDSMYDKSLGRRRRYLSQGWEESGWTNRGT